MVVGYHRAVTAMTQGVSAAVVAATEATSAWAPENPRGPQTDHQDKKAESVLGLAGAANRDKEAAMPAITLAGGLLPAHQRPPPAVRLVLPGPRGLEQPAFAGETLGNEVPCENCLFYVACFL